MKKAKIVLSAVALFAVVGGAFAFKATRYALPNIYYKNAAGVCTPYTSIYSTATATSTRLAFTTSNCPGNAVTVSYTTNPEF